MINKKTFDVLVVYSDAIAMSASAENKKVITPFSRTSTRANYNDAYAYFLETCKKNGISAAFTTTDAIIGAGTCSSYWIYSNKKWKKVKQQGSSYQIFEKFSPRNAKRKQQWRLLFSSPFVKSFNNKLVFSLFLDKQKTYQRLTKYMIPSIPLITAKRSDITIALEELKKLTASHINHNDFDQSIILKDRRGAGGESIYKIENDHIDSIFKQITNEKDISFIIQPHLKFQSGFRYRNKLVGADIRLIYQNGIVIQSYLRIAKTDEFRCNEHQGASVVYIETKDIPQNVFKISQNIISQISSSTSLFALDFLVSDLGNVYLIEGNVGPGINWTPVSKSGEVRSKELIREIVGEISSRVIPVNSAVNSAVN